MIIYPYKPASESSKALAQALGIKRISHTNSRFKGAADKVVINWGASKVSDEVAKCNILNKPDAVAIGSNKLSFFQKVSPLVVDREQWPNGRVWVRAVVGGRRVALTPDHGHVIGLGVGDQCHGDAQWVVDQIDPPVGAVVYARTPEWTANRMCASSWLGQGFLVVARTILNGNSGAGIVLVNPGEELVRAPLYVKYVPKKQEYRVHVFQGNVVDVQRKARRKDVPDDAIDWKIRNHANGFIFARGEDLGEVPQDVLDQSVLAMNLCGLDFGAVDVIYNDKEAKAYVLEVNTAPGLSGSTLDGYVERFRHFM